MAVKGTVSKTYAKDWQGDEGTIQLHSFQIQGDKRYFRTGTNKLVSEGESVSFDVVGNNNVENLQKLAAETVSAPKPASGGGYAPNANGGGNRFRGGNAGFNKPKSNENFEARQKYWEDKEKRDIEVVEPRITFSAAQRDAIEVVGIALQHDLLAFGNAAKSAKLGLLLDYVDEVTARFYAQRIDAAATAAGFAPADTDDGAGAEEGSDDE